MSLNLVCNFKKCRKNLSNHAWVTSCSHAFCSDHGIKEFTSKSPNVFQCPACGSLLKDKFDVIQADLNPTETFKSIVLAGLKPDVIMDIAMRAMSFWSYQVEQETHYQENVAKYTKEKLQCTEELNNLNLQKLKAEIQACKRKICALQTEYHKKKKQNEELTASVEEKNRRIQKLNFQLDLCKKKDLVVEKVEKNMKWSDMNSIMAQRVINSNNFVFQPASASRINTSTFKSPLMSPLHRRPAEKTPYQFIFKP